MDPVAAKTPVGRNTFYWGGAFGTWFWIDPTNDVVVVGMIQNVSGSSPTGGSPRRPAAIPTARLSGVGGSEEVRSELWRR